MPTEAAINKSWISGKIKIGADGLLIKASG
jgi:hypothetical protein